MKTICVFTDFQVGCYGIYWVGFEVILRYGLQVWFRDMGTVLTVGFVVIGTTFLTYLFNIYALTKVSPTIIGSYIYLQPAISFLMVSLYAVVFNENTYSNDIGFVKIASCLLVASGVYLTSKSNKTKLV